MNQHAIRDSLSLFAVTALAVLALISCNELSKLGGPPSPEEEEAALKERVQARWVAVLADDWDQVYEFATPVYRKTFPKKHFFNQYGGQIYRTDIEFKSITFENPERTEAKVVGSIIFETDAFGKPYKGRNYHEEHWTKVDDKWWHAEPR